jgi:osmotically inducible protein OsmC
MAIAHAKAEWKGTLKEGSGHMSVGSGALNGPFTWASRFADGKGTNPEELIGAAHAGCFSMFLSAKLTANGTPPTSVSTTATVTLGDGPTVTAIELTTVAVVPDIDQTKFDELVAVSKAQCPISKALAAVPSVTVKATLKR